MYNSIKALYSFGANFDKGGIQWINMKFLKPILIS